MSKLGDDPSTDAIPDCSWLASKEERQDILQSVSSAVVNHFKRSQPPSSTSDRVKSYASEVLSLGLFHEELPLGYSMMPLEREMVKECCDAGNSCY